ncbi:MAG: hypothetical protein ACOY40_12735 [Bacillota bacterium]
MTNIPDATPSKKPIFETRPPPKNGYPDDIPLSSYSPPPFKVKNPEIQTSPPENRSPGPYPSKDTFPDTPKKTLK